MCSPLPRLRGGLHQRQCRRLCCLRPCCWCRFFVCRLGPRSASLRHTAGCGGVFSWLTRALLVQRGLLDWTREGTHIIQIGSLRKLEGPAGHGPKVWVRAFASQQDLSEAVATLVSPWCASGFLPTGVKLN